MKEKFENRKLTGPLRLKLERDDHSCGKYWEADKATLVRSIVNVIEDFEDQGYKLTLRQLYYQLVARNIMPNDQICYGKLSALLDDCRYSGAVDWDSIEDRGRIPHTPYYEHSVEDAIRRTKSSYSLDKRVGQDTYVELWSEKDAISNILKEAVSDHTITVGINKGFASSTAIHNAYERFARRLLSGKRVVVLYFGDHDPSGLDMVRDIRARLEFMLSKGTNQEALIALQEDPDMDDDARIFDLMDEFDLYGKYREELEKYDSGKNGDWMAVKALAVVKSMFEVRHIGLTMDQIQFFNLPPNPAKMTDPRAKGYVAEHGDISWEVDALSPSDIRKIIEESLEDVIDWDKYKEREAQEEADLKRLDKVISGEGFESKFKDPDEWGDWVCPKCGHEQGDPEDIHSTQCEECETGVVLSDVVDGKRKAKLA